TGTTARSRLPPLTWSLSFPRPAQKRPAFHPPSRAQRAIARIALGFVAVGSQTLDRPSEPTRRWVDEAIRRVDADANRSADTHLHVFPIPASWGVDLYLKDESVHPTGSLKHRLARSLFLYGLCNGWIGPDTTIIEASSGSTAVSEAYFARLLGLPFVAVMPASTSPSKIALIEFQGGRCHLVDDASAIYAESHRLAAASGGLFMAQFPHWARG